MYNYWEVFVQYWKNKKIRGLSGNDYLGWSNPDDINCPLFNDSSGAKSSNYIPEPWWGNDGSQPLHSVVINFNPGAGDYEQKYDVIPYSSSYSKDIVLNGNVLPLTAAWHWKNRGKPILEALKNINFIDSYTGLENHLSIELIPWHTKKVDKYYWKYLENNIQAVFDHSILFAANESRRICNSKLNSKVIIRAGGNATNKLIDCLSGIGVICNNNTPSIVQKGKGNYMKFTIDKIPDITFVSIWGTNSWNGLPPAATLNEILKKI